MIKSIIKNKRGAFTDLFLWMIVSIIIVLISVLFIYMGNRVSDQLHESLDDLTTRGTKAGTVNYTKQIDENIGDLNSAYNLLHWISIFLIIGMVIAIFIGSYMVTTKPVFFVPYAFIVMICIIVAVGLSTAYEMIYTNETLSSTFEDFVGSNFILLHLPTWVTIIGFAGGIIMFVRWQHGREDYYG